MGEEPVRERRGGPTRERILDAALGVLREVGHGGFSVPRVAEAASVYQGNVTYYFPTRADLLVAMADRAVVQYREAFRLELAELDASDSAWAEDLIRWLQADAIVPETVRLFPELWSLANSAEDIGVAVCRLYETAVDALIEALGHDPTDPATTELRAVVFAIGVVSEGTTAVHGHRGATHADVVASRELLVEVLAPRLVAAHAALVDRRRDRHP
ncbi:MAG: TetR/AcrR family transcriptional regulator [Nitriliruptoraceae bacterium]|nr:TetR/AcrR family transcriptional regulator [Nitriliruptoraceae bacterium]